jgi:hypothetical protein
MDARCGLSTLGPWADLVICNEWKGITQHGERFRQWEHAALLWNYYSYYNNYFLGALINNANNTKIIVRKKIQFFFSQKSYANNRRGKNQHNSHSKTIDNNRHNI